MRFKTLEDLRAACLDLPAGDDAAAEAASRRQDTLTKPQGSLGRLETLVAWLARWQGRAMPRLDKVKVIVFAGSHGVTAQGVSAFPSEVTAQMVANFAAGGAAINQLARAANAELDVIPLEIERPTGDFTQGPAMNADEFLAAVAVGYEAVTKDSTCFASARWASATPPPPQPSPRRCLAASAEKWVGRGTGVDDAGLQRKAVAIYTAMKLHADILDDPLQIAAAVGGRELAAMLGAALAARKLGVPLMLDGFVTAAAVAPLAKLNPAGLAHAVAGHVSAEAGHRRLLEVLGLDPLLDLGMRLGEGSGGCLAVNIVRGALACHTGMASFAEAGVSDR